MDIWKLWFDKSMRNRKANIFRGYKKFAPAQCLYMYFNVLYIDFFISCLPWNVFKCSCLSCGHVRVGLGWEGSKHIDILPALGQLISYERKKRNIQAQERFSFRNINRNFTQGFESKSLYGKKVRSVLVLRKEKSALFFWFSKRSVPDPDQESF